MDIRQAQETELLTFGNNTNMMLVYCHSDQVMVKCPLCAWIAPFGNNV